MPGTVDSTVTYTLTANPPQLHTHISAISPDQRSPVMPTQHTYWNLDGFSNPSTDLIWNHTLSLPYSRRLLEPDPNMVPTGKISSIPKNSVNDFWSEPHQLGFASGDAEFATNCGTASGCAGYNNLLIIDQPPNPNTQNPAVTLTSSWSGIQVEYFTALPGVVVYSCYWMNGNPQPQPQFSLTKERKH
jgi:aldose 1-epimerase